MNAGPSFFFESVSLNKHSFKKCLINQNKLNLSSKATEKLKKVQVSSSYLFIIISFFFFVLNEIFIQLMYFIL